MTYLESFSEGKKKLPEGLSLQQVQAVIDQRWVKDLLAWAREDPDQREVEYVLVRKFLIQHPWVTEDQLQTELKDLLYFDRSKIGEVYDAAYQFDHLARHNELYWACPHCGGLLSWINDRPRCAKDAVCNRLSDLRTGIPVQPTRDIRRLKWGIHTRVCVPGKTEVELFEWLREQGVDVKLWPGVDQYDLWVAFSSTVWAVDVKDYESPVGLVDHILTHPFNRFEDDPLLSWNRAFFIIPSYREKIMPGYRDQVRERIKDRLPADIQIMYDRQFRDMVNRQIKS